MMVIESSASGRPVTNLKIVKMSITMPHANCSHIMHMKKDKKVCTVMKPGGAAEVFVLKRMKRPMSAPGMVASRDDLNDEVEVKDSPSLGS